MFLSEAPQIMLALTSASIHSNKYASTQYGFILSTKMQFGWNAKQKNPRWTSSRYLPGIKYSRVLCIGPLHHLEMKNNESIESHVEGEPSTPLVLKNICPRLARWLLLHDASCWTFRCRPLHGPPKKPRHEIQIGTGLLRSLEIPSQAILNWVKFWLGWHFLFLVISRNYHLSKVQCPMILYP